MLATKQNFENISEFNGTLFDKDKCKKIITKQNSAFLIVFVTSASKMDKIYQ
jgi:hypothetical protein